MTVVATRGIYADYFTLRPGAVFVDGSASGEKIRRWLGQKFWLFQLDKRGMELCQTSLRCSRKSTFLMRCGHGVDRAAVAAMAVLFAVTPEAMRWPRERLNEAVRSADNDGELLIDDLDRLPPHIDFKTLRLDASEVCLNLQLRARDEVIPWLRPTLLAWTIVSPEKSDNWNSRSIPVPLREIADALTSGEYGWAELFASGE